MFLRNSSPTGETGSTGAAKKTLVTRLLLYHDEVDALEYISSTNGGHGPFAAFNVRIGIKDVD